MFCQKYAKALFLFCRATMNCKPCRRAYFNFLLATVTPAKPSRTTSEGTFRDVVATPLSLPGLMMMVATMFDYFWWHSFIIYFRRFRKPYWRICRVCVSRKRRTTVLWKISTSRLSPRVKAVLDRHVCCPLPLVTCLLLSMKRICVGYKRLTFAVDYLLKSFRLERRKIYRNDPWCAGHVNSKWSVHSTKRSLRVRSQASASRMTCYFSNFCCAATPTLP